MPPEKTAGGRERNQQETGVFAFPQLKISLGACGYEARLGWVRTSPSDQTRAVTICPISFQD